MEQPSDDNSDYRPAEITGTRVLRGWHHCAPHWSTLGRKRLRVLRRGCAHARGVRIERLPLGYVHFARARCCVCGKHLRYLPWPEGMEEQAERARGWLRWHYRWLVRETARRRRCSSHGFEDV